MAQQSRTLTHDEVKASEAAFKGLPFDPAWSKSARAVYDGIVQAMGNTPFDVSDAPPEESSSESAAQSVQSANQEENLDTPSAPGDETEDATTLTLTTGSLPLTSRKDAISAGIVKEATPAAQRIGLEYPVGLTNALWDHYVASPEDVKDATNDHIQSRLMDIMVGVRLRLASLKEAVPFVDVPVLLQVPEETTPQINLVFALFHRDPEEGQCLLLIHPSEIFSPRQNISQN